MKYFVKKRIFAFVFIAALLTACAYNAYINGEGIYKYLLELLDTGEFDAGTMETRILEDVPMKMDMVETFGLVQKLMLKREYNDFEYIKDEDGFLHYTSFYREDSNDLFACAKRIKKLQNYVEKYGTKVMVVIPPSKYDPEYTVFKAGMPVNDRNMDVIELSVYLRRLGVEVYNLADDYPNEELPYEDYFFRTDHHWTISAAFQATGAVVREIDKRFGENLDPTGYYTSGEAYEVKRYKGHMLGAMGRDTGVMYSGLEDFVAYLPVFEGNFTRTYMDDDAISYTNHGSVRDALMDMEVLDDGINYYKVSQYALYMDQVMELDEVINNDNPEGPSIGMIRDSFFGPTIAFMAPMCSRIDALYSLEDLEELDITDYIKDKYAKGEGYDYFLIEYSPYNIEENSFRFFRGNY